MFTFAVKYYHYERLFFKYPILQTPVVGLCLVGFFYAINLNQNT